MTAAASVLEAIATEGMRYVWVLSQSDRRWALFVGVGAAVAIVIATLRRGQRSVSGSWPEAHPEVRTVERPVPAAMGADEGILPAVGPRDERLRKKTTPPAPAAADARSARTF